MANLEDKLVMYLDRELPRDLMREHIHLLSELEAGMFLPLLDDEEA